MRIEMSATPETTDEFSFMKILNNTVLLPVAELYSLMPDSILFGSLLLYVMTQNASYGIFALFIFETVISHRFVSWIMTQTFGPAESSKDINIKCRAGFKTPQLDVRRIFMHDQYPSYSIFSITAIGTYLGLSTNEFSNTFEAMGAEWAGRSMSAYLFIALVIVAFIFVRTFKCDEPVSEMLISCIFAIIVGVIFFTLHKMIFGIESVNFLGLPYLVDKASQGAPIYVCAADTSK